MQIFLYYISRYLGLLILCFYLCIRVEAQNQGFEMAKDSVHQELPELSYQLQAEVPFDPRAFKDPIYVKLIDVPQKKFWSPPLPNTRLKTSGFGLRWGKFHHGIDLGLRWGSPVLAVFDGEIIISSYERGYGNYILIKHDNGLETLYAHLAKRAVKPKEKVKAGQLIGYGGSTGFSTGPHLHFEVRYQGYTMNPQLLFDFNSEWQLRSDIFFIKPTYFRHYGNREPSKTYLYYEVGSQESLEEICQRFEVSVESVLKINHLKSPELEVGQMIRIW